MSTVGAALQDAATQLRPISPTARLDAELLLAHVLGSSRIQIIASLRDPLDMVSAVRFAELVARRVRMEPIAYLVGEREFYGLPFQVDQRVLVPRPETELLVDLALRKAVRYAQQPVRIADIGTGSGAIAIAVAHHLPQAHVYAVDISSDALCVARANVERHGLGDRVVLINGDKLTALPEPVDLLLTNPPYTVLAGVDANVREYEPHLALDGGGDDGLAFIRELLLEAPRHVTGTMLIELGAWQGVEATRLAHLAFPGSTIVLHQDLAGRDRVLEIDVI